MSSIEFANETCEDEKQTKTFTMEAKLKGKIQIVAMDEREARELLEDYISDYLLNETASLYEVEVIDSTLWDVE